MIRHIVMFDFAKEAEGKSDFQNAQIAKELLLTLPEKLNFIRKMEVGLNADNADGSNYKLCLTCDFDTIDDLNQYIVHPEHQRVAAFIGKVRTSRACIDYVI